MNKLFTNLKGKIVHITFKNAMYDEETYGKFAENFEVIDCIDGFLKLKDRNGKIEFYNLDTINTITESKRNNVINED